MFPVATRILALMAVTSADSNVASFVSTGDFYGSVKTGCDVPPVTLCALDSPSTETHDRVSPVQCSVACRGITNCSWFNFSQADGPRTGSCDGRGLCQLFNYRPRYLSPKSGCKLFQVG